LRGSRIDGDDDSVFEYETQRRRAVLRFDVLDDVFLEAREVFDFR
jgi:hypothetical protein